MIEQTYPGIEDEKMHFAFLLKAFKDNRYINVNVAPLLYIFAPKDVPQEYLDNFKKWTKEAGFTDLYLVGNITNQKITKDSLIAMGYNAVSYQRLGGITSNALRNMGRAGRGMAEC